jgi:hypothetical protein
MAMKEQKDRDRSPQKSAESSPNENKGIILVLITFIYNTIKWLFFSLLFSITVSFIGLTFIWTEQGSAHERATLETEVTYLADELQSGSSFVQLLMKTQDTVIWRIPDSFGRSVDWVLSVFNENLTPYGESANYAMRIFIVRLIIMTSSVPILVVYLVAAIAIGLVERDLRKFNLARESSTKFHLILNNVHLPLIWLMMCYLSWPVTAHPMPFILPGYALFGVLVFTMVSGYKKYF